MIRHDSDIRYSDIRVGPTQPIEYLKVSIKINPLLQLKRHFFRDKTLL